MDEWTARTAQTSKHATKHEHARLMNPSQTKGLLGQRLSLNSNLLLQKQYFVKYSFHKYTLMVLPTNMTNVNILQVYTCMGRKTKVMN